MTYRIGAIAMTLSDCQGHSPIASFFKWNFSYSDAAVEKFLTDIERRVMCNSGGFCLQ